MPDPIETLKAAEILVREGFTVLPYINADPVLAKRLQEAGAAAVMPLGAPIGTNKGVLTRELINIIIEQAIVPVVVDAGLGAPSHAAEALEMGADAVLVNTAIAASGSPSAMAEAFALACRAGRMAYLSGLFLPSYSHQPPDFLPALKGREKAPVFSRTHGSRNSGNIFRNLPAYQEFQDEAGGYKQHNQRNQIRLAEEHLVKERPQNKQHQKKAQDDKQRISLSLFPEPPMGDEHRQVADQKTGPRQIGDGYQVKGIRHHQNPQQKIEKTLRSVAPERLFKNSSQLAVARQSPGNVQHAEHGGING